MTKGVKSALIILGCLIGILIYNPCYAHPKIVLVGSQDIKEVPQMHWLVLIYTEAFHRLGFEFQYVVIPLARGTMIVKTGLADGEIQRPGEYQKDNPNLVRIEESPASVKYVAYAIKPGITVQGWDSLKDTRYSIEYRLGASRSETELVRIVAPEKLSYILTTEQGLKKLILGRTDVFIDLEHNIFNSLKKLKQEKIDTSVFYLAGVMQETRMFAYLAKKHADLASKVSIVLREMKQEGLIEQYRKEALDVQN